MSDSADPDLEETNTATQRVSSRTTTGERAINPAQSLGRYMVLSKVGEGGMGQVYAAYDPKLDRRVALKLLHPQNNPGDGDRLMREAKALAKLSDPHVVTVHEVDEFGGRPLIAMEFVEGLTLKEWLTGNPPGHGEERVQEALELLVQAGRGLAAAHAQELVHRDFKPGNVLVGKDGRVRVADFGLARPVRSEVEVTATEDEDSRPASMGVVDLTRTGVAIGTPAYMAPEQFAGKRVDERCDQFSYCVTAWEVLFGVRPYQGKRVDGLLAAFRAGGLQRPQEVQVPQGVEKLLRKGLSVRPGARHQSMAVLLEELQRELDVLRGRLSPPKRWTGWRYIGIAAVLAAGIVGVHEAVFGKEHATTAATYNNVGLANEGAEEFGEAFRFYRKVLAIYEQDAENKHPNATEVHASIRRLCEVRKLERACETTP